MHVKSSLRLRKPGELFGTFQMFLEDSGAKRGRFPALHSHNPKIYVIQSPGPHASLVDHIFPLAMKSFQDCVFLGQRWLVAIAHYIVHR